MSEAGVPDVGRPLVLLNPLDASQQRVVDILAHVFFAESAQWPTFQYLQARLDQDHLDAAAVLTSFPAVGGRTFGERRYAAIWAENFGLTPHHAGRVGLTVAGFEHCRGPLRESAQSTIRIFLQVVAVMVQDRRTFLPSPTEVEELRVTDGDIRDALRRLGAIAHAWDPGAMYRVMEHEPPLYGGSRSYSDTSWTWEPTRDLLEFEGVRDLADYVERVSVLVTPPVTQAVRSSPSPLGLVAALDYLEAVWRNVPGHTDHLVHFQRGEATAKLAYPANTADEFASRLTALGDVLKTLRVPKGGDQHGGHPVERLRQYLLWRLDEGSPDRVNAAADTLTDVVAVRNAGQHAEADAASVAALKRLGITYPILDWSSAWDAIRSETITALEAIREELAGSQD